MAFLKMDAVNEKKRLARTNQMVKCLVFFFFFFFSVYFRLSARISDFENILLMVHVGGVHACAAGARYATFFFTNARF